MSANAYLSGERAPDRRAGAVPANCGVTGFTGRGSWGNVDAAPISPPARMPGIAGFGMSGCGVVPRFTMG